MSRVGPNPELLAALEARRVNKPKVVAKPAPVAPAVTKAPKKQSTTTKTRKTAPKKQVKATPAPQPPKRRKRRLDESTEDLWVAKPDSKPVQTETVVYSLPKHKVFEGFSSTLVEKTTVKDGKRIKSIEKPAAASTSLPTPTTVKNTTRTSSAPRKTPSVRKPRARTNSTEKKVSKEPTKSKEKTKSNADRPRAASKVDPVPIMEPKKPKKPPVIKLSSAFKAKGTTDEEKDAEEHALEAQRIFAERARKKRLQTISASPEKQIKRKEVREVSPVREKSLKKPKTPKELPLERKRELQGAPRKKSRNRDEHKQRYSSLSPPRSVTGKRARPRTSEPPRKRRRPMPEPSSEEDEELDDFIVSDEEEERFAAPSFRRPGRRERDPYRGRSRRDYYSDDSPDMESSFLDIEEEERQSYEIAKREERKERIREERRQLEKKRRLGLI